MILYNGKVCAYIDLRTLKIYYLAIFVYVIHLEVSDFEVCIRISCAPLHIQVDINKSFKNGKLFVFIQFLLSQSFTRTSPWLHSLNTPPQNQNKHNY